MNREEAEIRLREVFKLEKFYDEQWQTIEELLKGKRVLLIEKTGFGKSLCFQFPAIVYDGVTIIFSPLIALMRDQVKKLNSLGIRAGCIISEQAEEENTQIIKDAKEGKYKILYIAPERMENDEWIAAVKDMNLSMVVVDEAHCISIWGHDFRPAFKRIINLVKLLPKDFPILATTATATKRVEEDVAKQIGEGIKVIRGNLIRDNFKLFVIRVESEDEKLIWLGKNIDKFPGTGIIYTGTRVNTEIYSKWFEHLKISAVGYNGGLDAATRVEIENGLMNNRWKCVVSTNALGMGIDKPDIRFIIHTQFPQSPIHYYQEIGRAGRDGKTTYIILFYNPADRDLPEAFIESGRPSIIKYFKVIDAVKNEMHGEKELMKIVNIKQTQLRVIKADLLEQKIIREVSIGRSKKFEYIANAPELDYSLFEECKKLRMEDLENMIEYMETKDSRMKFLCDYLGDNYEHTKSNCDNTGEKKLKVTVTPEWTDKLKEFRDNYFPTLEVENSRSNLKNGVAGSFYGASNVGRTIHRCKYAHGGDYPEFLINKTIKAYRHKFADKKFDLVLYIPPTVSGDLVRNFAVTIAKRLGFKISHNLIKHKKTKEQKMYENGYLKSENVKDSFEYRILKEIKGKKILLIDDIYDSGATIKEIGRYLTKEGALEVAPLVIAKTVGGDIAC
ncbi:MAG: RecQ family ATP-dependent DNA helicase [Ignavibacteriae bacterium]|nr:RecQ family ATP-dependent DNA helicase [Ignavibacteriota bacterium]